MKLIQKDNELIIKEAPGSLWIFGLFFIGVAGTILYGSLGGFTNHRELSRWQILLAFFMGSFGVLTGLWIIYNAPITHVTIDRTKRILTLTRQGIHGKTENIYPFSKVKEFCVIEELDDEGDPVWSLGLKLNDGETIKISSLSTPSESYKRDFVFQANAFLGKQLPGYRKAFDDEDEITGQIR